MLISILTLAKKTIRRITGFKVRESRIEKLYKEKEYLEAYSWHTDFRVDEDPKSAIGGMWEELGNLQFEFLVNKNLEPYHKMLDLGCGTLRGGRHFIRYLQSGNYYGIDISSKAIAYAKQLVQLEGLSTKTPHLLVSKNMDLKFEEFCGQKFDYILAQSVFTHLKPEHITECFRHIDNIMKTGSLFYFTYKNNKNKDENSKTSLKDFHYTLSFFESLAEKNGFRLRDCSKDYNHPRGQIMVELRC